MLPSHLAVLNWLRWEDKAALFILLPLDSCLGFFYLPGHGTISHKGCHNISVECGGVCLGTVIRNLGTVIRNLGTVISNRRTVIQNRRTVIQNRRTFI